MDSRVAARVVLQVNGGERSLRSGEDFVDIDTRRTMVPAQADPRNRRKSRKNSAVFHLLAIGEAVQVRSPPEFTIDYQAWRLSSKSCGFVGVSEPGTKNLVINCEIKLDTCAICIHTQWASSQSPWIQRVPSQLSPITNWPCLRHCAPYFPGEPMPNRFLA